MSQQKSTENQTDGIVREAEAEEAKEHRKNICIIEIEIKMKLVLSEVCSVEENLD